MKTLIKLVLAALVVYACWRLGTAYLRYYTFRDDVRGVALFSEGKTEADLRTRVLEIAVRERIPIKDDQLTVMHDMNHTVINLSYTEQLELLPTYIRPWEFRVNVDSFNAR